MVSEYVEQVCVALDIFRRMLYISLYVPGVDKGGVNTPFDQGLELACNQVLEPELTTNNALVFC